MIQVKSEFKKGKIELLEIYDNEYKILETTNNQLWNTDEKNPIVIRKARRDDYVSSTIIAEKIEFDNNEEEDKTNLLHPV